MNERPPCQATRVDGRPCSAPALPDRVLCFAHIPAAAEGRKRGGQNGRSTIRAVRHMPPELAAIQAKLISLMEKVEKGEVRDRSAEVIGQLAGRVLDYAQFALDAEETRVLDRRLKEVEEAVALVKRTEAAS